MLSTDKIIIVEKFVYILNEALSNNLSNKKLIVIKILIDLMMNFAVSDLDDELPLFSYHGFI